MAPRVAALALALVAGGASAIRLRSDFHAAVMSKLTSTGGKFTACQMETMHDAPDLIGEATDPCCSASVDTSNSADQCYHDLCAAGGDCNTFCATLGSCYDAMCINGGACDTKLSYQALTELSGVSGVGAVVDKIANCSSVMMTNDGSECGYRLDCAYLRVGFESPCGYWCGQTLSEEQCNSDASTSMEQNTQGGGCEWDETRTGVCKVETVMNPTNPTKKFSETTFGCTSDMGPLEDNSCTAYFTDGTGADLANAPWQCPAGDTPDTNPSACTKNDPCPVCTDGACGGGTPDRETAKCRAVIDEPNEKVLDVRSVTVKAIDFPGEVIPLHCPGIKCTGDVACDPTTNTDADVATMTYETTIDSSTERLNTCTVLSRSNSKCFWVNKGVAKGCISNMCTHLNTADLCTLQESGGRCTWYEKKTKDGQVANPRRPGHVGCFTSPCMNPGPNKSWKCEANGANAALGGCKRTCGDAKQEPGFKSMSDEDFFDLFPMCDPGSEKFGCPCTPLDTLKKLPLSNKKLFKNVAEADLYSGRDAQCTATQGTCVTIADETVSCPLSSDGQCLEEDGCKAIAKGDWQYNGRYCPAYGPCMPASDVSDIWVPVTGNNKQRKKYGEYYIQDTFYKCRWASQSDSIGEGAVGCQNMEATSDSSGNSVGCDSLRIDGECPDRPPWPNTCFSNPFCAFCQPCDPSGSGGCNPNLGKDTCQSVTWNNGTTQCYDTAGNAGSTC